MSENDETHFEIEWLGDNRNHTADRLTTNFIIKTCCLALLSCSAMAQAVSLDIVEDERGLILTFETEKPISSLALGANGQFNPAARLSPTDSNVNLIDGTIGNAEATSRFSLLLQPDETEKRSTYPVLTVVPGRGYVLYAPPILPTEIVTGIRYTDRDGEILELSPDSAKKGYLFLGRRDASLDSYDLVIGDNVPQSLRDEVLPRIDAILAYYSDKFKRMPGRKPLIVLSSVVSDENANRGDVTENGVVFLRYKHESIETISDQFRSLSTAFLAHELFHLWTDRESKSSDGWWLHEGAAEYASWQSVEDLWPALATLERKIESAINNCSAMLRHLSMTNASPGMKSRGRYTCGGVIHWIADIGFRNSGNGSAFNSWGDIWPGESQTSNEKIVVAFLDEVGRSSPAALVLVDSILNGTGTQRWVDIVHGLVELGADIEVQAPSPFSMRVAATQAVVLSACGAFWGVGEKDGQLFGQAPPSCDLFGQSQVIEMAGGFSPMEDAKGYLNHVEKKCANGDKIEIRIREGEVAKSRKIVCSAPVQLPPPRLTIREAGVGRGLANFVAQDI